MDLIKALKYYKVDVYSDATDRETLTRFLEGYGKTVYQGQKRIVVKENDVVIKIAYSLQGLRDNIQECICSHHLADLQRRGVISADQLNRFGLAASVDGDPFVIKMSAGLTIDQDPDFNRWYDLNKDKYPSYQKVSCIPLWIKDQPQLAEDFNTIQIIAAREFIGSDISLNEPLNFVVDIEHSNYGNKKRLRLIDMGSCLPVFKNNQTGQDSRPRCPYCSNGGKLVYLPYRLEPGSDIDLAELGSLEGKYGCLNPNCSEYYKGDKIKNSKPDINNKDFVVFSNYLREQRGIIRYYEALIGNFFVPNEPTYTLDGYMNALRSTLGITKNREIVERMYDNYLAKMIGDTLVRNPEINQIGVVENGSARDLQMYANDVVNAMKNNGNFLGSNNMVRRLVCMTYLKKLVAVGSKGQIDLFDILLSADKRTFFAQLGNVLNERTMQILFDGLRIA